MTGVKSEEVVMFCKRYSSQGIRVLRLRWEITKPYIFGISEPGDIYLLRTFRIARVY